MEPKWRGLKMPDWTGRKVTGFDRDDGQEIDELAWAPDGRQSQPGLESHQAGAGDLVRGLLSRAGQRLTEGHAPTISPRGDTVAFLRGGQIFLMKPAGEEVKNVITEKRNSIRVGLVAGWKHARVRQRAGAVSFIGLYSRADNTLRFLDASVDKDTSPIWSPDGNQIASFAA